MPVPKPTLSSLPLRGPKKLVTPKSTGGRLSAAKEASQGYSLLKEKLSPGFRAMPATMEGLASLAEERIQEARARGEFKHLPGRGKPAKKDHLNDSPHIDRTGMSPCPRNNGGDGRVLFESDLTTTGCGATVGSSTSRSYFCVRTISPVNSNGMASSCHSTNFYRPRKLEQSYLCCGSIRST